MLGAGPDAHETGEDASRIFASTALAAGPGYPMNGTGTLTIIGSYAFTRSIETAGSME